MSDGAQPLELISHLCSVFIRLFFFFPPLIYLFIYLFWSCSSESNITLQDNLGCV